MAIELARSIPITSVVYVLQYSCESQELVQIFSNIYIYIYYKLIYLYKRQSRTTKI